MKKLFLLAAMLGTLALSCSRQVDRDPIGPIPGDPPGPPPGDPPPGGGGGAVYVSSCTTSDPPVPTTYTPTLVDLVAPGFGLFADVNYDKGWKQGYEDAVFYHNYYQINVPEGNYCLLTLKQGIQDYTQPGSIRYESASYTLQPGEINMGLFVQSSPCNTNWIIRRCVLKNAYDVKGLRLQYEFNKNYVGSKTYAEIQYDNGRYDGFWRGITQEPFQ